MAKWQRLIHVWPYHMRYNSMLQMETNTILYARGIWDRVWDTSWVFFRFLRALASKNQKKTQRVSQTRSQILGHTRFCFSDTFLVTFQAKITSNRCFFQRTVAILCGELLEQQIYIHTHTDCLQLFISSQNTKFLRQQVRFMNGLLRFTMKSSPLLCFHWLTTQKHNNAIFKLSTNQIT